MAVLDDGVDRLLERRRRRQGDDRDARDHDLVDALLAELDDRVDHLLLLGLEDALLAAPLDDQAQLLGADPLVGRDVGAEQPADPPRRPGQDADERAEERPRKSIGRLDDEREALGVGEGDLLGTSSPKTIVKRRQDDRHDDQGDRVRARPGSGPKSASQAARGRRPG